MAKPLELTHDGYILVTHVHLALDFNDALPITAITSEALEQQAVVGRPELNRPGVLLFADLASDLNTLTELAVGFTRSAEQGNFCVAVFRNVLRSMRFSYSVPRKMRCT